MTTTPIESFARKECDLIDPLKVNAFFDLILDPENPTGVILQTSWGDISLDLKDIVKNGETVTRLLLAPEDDPTVIRFEREDGEVDCITGDELSRIISLTLLKDVNQENTYEDGDVLVYNSTTNEFNTLNVVSSLSDLNTTVGRLQALITNLQNQINTLSDRVTALETLLTKPSGIPDNATLVWGNIDLFSDYTNTDNRNWGLYTHDINNLIPNDEMFS